MSVVAVQDFGEHADVSAAVEQDVVIGPHEPPVFAAKPHEGEAEQRRRAQGEAPRTIFSEQRLPAGRLLRGREGGVVVDFPGHGRVGGDPLDGFGRAVPGKGGAQDGVAGDCFGPEGAQA